MGSSAVSRLKLRSTFVLLHRYSGLFIAFFLIVAGISGTAIAFYKELDCALNPELYRVVERSPPALSANALALKVNRAYPQAVINLMTLDRTPGESVRVRLTPRINSAIGNDYSLNFTEIFLDPFDGQILGGRDRGVFHADRAHLMPFLYRVHYTLYVPGKWGEWFMGVIALVWMFDCFVSFWVTLPPSSSASRRSPKSWWQRWKPAWQIKPGASTTRLNFDLHRASGLWLWIVFFMLAFTGVYFNLTTQVFRPVLSWFGSVTPESAKTLAKLSQAAAPSSISFDDAIVKGRAALAHELQYMVPAYVGINPGTPGIYRVRFADPGRGDATWRFRYENLFLDGSTGELLMRVGYSNGTPADKFMLWQYPLHSGQIFGFWGRVFIGIVGLVVVLLTLTGVVIWLKKRRAGARRFLRAAGIESTAEAEAAGPA